MSNYLKSSIPPIRTHGRSGLGVGKKSTGSVPDTLPLASAAMAGPYQLAAVPDGLGHDWLAVWLDRYGIYWLEVGDDYNRVTRDGAGNWVSVDRLPTIYTRSGAITTPAESPLTLLDLFQDPQDLEVEILTLAAERLERGETLDIATEARVRIARSRLAEVAT